MKYIIFDLEWNQRQPHRKEIVNKKGLPLRNEIMQIGAVKIDENHQMESNFFADVKLKYNKVLNRYVAKVVGLTQKDMTGGRPFGEVIEEFQKWCGSDVTFLTWGYDDVPVLKENLDFYGMPTAWLDNWYNAQLFFHDQYKTEFPQMSLAGAMEMLEITTDMQMHNALTDAACTASVCEKLDIEYGITRYWYLKPAPKVKKTALKLTKVYGNIASKNKALNRKDIFMGRCPECGKQLYPLTFLWVAGENKRSRLFTCEEHGDFIFHYRVFQNKESKTWAINKNVYAVDEELVSYYLKKNEINELVAAQ